MIFRIRALAGKFLVLCLLLSSWANGLATEQPAYMYDYELIGHILDLNNSTINVGDMLFEISPTVKVKTASKDKASTMDLKVGNYVGVRTILYYDRVLVDTIHVLPNPPENE
ncbi:MAG: hypothetical protein GY784_08235 [Gammaproteobacteria bacterium]|nr:hypothetical protein [Gammaproteobacteria bacterium]